MDTSSSPHMFDERDRFAEQYEFFSSFLLVLLDCEYEGKTLQQAVSDWLRSEAIIYDSRREIIEEGRAFMKQEELPWTLIREVSNYYFETKEEAFTWLSDALDQIEATLRA